MKICAYTAVRVLFGRLGFSSFHQERALPPPPPVCCSTRNEGVGGFVVVSRHDEDGTGAASFGVLPAVALASTSHYPLGLPFASPPLLAPTRIAPRHPSFQVQMSDGSLVATGNTRSRVRREGDSRPVTTLETTHSRRGVPVRRRPYTHLDPSFQVDSETTRATRNPVFHAATGADSR
jgi:hypothetical protein